MSTEPSGLIYCRALPLSRVRAFQGWPQDADSAELVVYLHEDLSVTKEPDPGSERLFASTTWEWRQFCRDDLGVPTSDAPQLRQSEEQQPGESATAHG